MRRRITTAKREEIEKEQQLLDKKIVRPFETLDDLPISYNEPPYGHYQDILKHPLTVKDLAVLYNSLIRSRNTYVFHAPMFKLHWVKQTAYAKKLAEMDIEKQKEILNDRENRRFAKATTNSLEARTRIPVLSADVNARDVMSKLCESSMTLGPHTMDVRIFIAKDARSDKSKALAEISKVNGLLLPNGMPIPPGGFPQLPQMPQLLPPGAQPLGATGIAPPIPPVVAPVARAPVPAPPPKVTEAKPSSEEPGKRSLDTDETSRSATPQAEPRKKSKSALPVKAELTSSKKGAAAETKKEAPTKTASQKPSADSGKGADAPKAAPTNLQSIDNTIMISNLNAIAKIDLSLNDLMKEVASGKASETQISVFKKYIERAKQMGPQPHHAELYLSRGLPLPASFPRPFQPRPLLERKTTPKPKLHNPSKLTAFQERYLYNATLVFEFLENPNVRYIIPQESICEVLPPDRPRPADAEEDSEYNDVLISTIWIHNTDDVENYEKAKAEYDEEMKKKKEEELAEAERKKKEEESGKDASAEPAPVEPRPLRYKRKPAPPKKPKVLVEPEYPHIKYTTHLFTVHNVPSRFVPIFVNSMKPLADVQKRMEHILKTGTRITSFYLWYQLDARLDEAFAENLRKLADEEEKKMTGYVPPVEPKKRKPRDYSKYTKAKKAREQAALELLQSQQMALYNQQMALQNQQMGAQQQPNAATNLPGQAAPQTGLAGAGDRPVLGKAFGQPSTAFPSASGFPAPAGFPTGLSVNGDSSSTL